MSEGPFAYVEAINKGQDREVGKDYNQFLINKALSYFPDTLPLVDYLNQHKNIPDEAHFKFLRATVRPQMRRSKWPKPAVSKELKAIMEYFNISQTAAEQYITVLSPERIQSIIDAFETGK